MEVTIISHSIAGFLLTTLRDKTTETPDFYCAIESISTILFINASSSFPSKGIKIETPLEKTLGSQPESKLVLVPILRAGLAMVQPVLRIFPDAVTYHIGAKRNEKTLEIITYYSNLNNALSDQVVYILDPMLATGGTLSYSLREVAKYNPSEIKILTVISSPEGLEKLSTVADNLKIPVHLWTASVDRELNDAGYILPGLGDAGDRAFGTLWRQV